MKYYVVRKGYTPGIYTHRDEAKKQIEGYSGAKYKSFQNLEIAQQAYDNNFMGEKGIYSLEHLRLVMGEDFQNSIATDAACPSNPGPIEYRGVDIAHQSEIFMVGPLEGGSTNIAEFLGIIHGLRRIIENKTHHTILYSDSTIAINRVQKKSLKTTIQEDDTNRVLRNTIRSAQERLSQHPTRSSRITLKKRPTKLWGQIPADFGRK